MDTKRMEANRRRFHCIRKNQE